MTLREPTAATVANFPLLKNNKYYKTRNKPVLGIVLHVTAGLQDLGMVGEDHSAEGTISYGQTTTRDASWHSIADTDSARFCLPSWYTAWQVKGYNSPTLGIEISNLDAKWSNKPKSWVEATIHNAAQLAACYVDKYDLPLLRASKATVDKTIANNRKFGFSYHRYLNPDTRVDPEVPLGSFPWVMFIGNINDILNGPAPIPVPPVVKEEEDMPRIVRVKGTKAEYITTGAHLYWIKDQPAKANVLATWPTINRTPVDVASLSGLGEQVGEIPKA